MWSKPGTNWPERRPIQRMENAGCGGVEIVRTRVPFRRLIPRFVRTGRMSLSAPFGGPDFRPWIHTLMISLKKPAAATAGRG
jgi:hypothetical protein